MLVLTRKQGEQIVINGDLAAGEVLIKVLAIRNGRVTIGLTAPDSVNVRRAELSPLESPDRVD